MFTGVEARQIGCMVLDEVQAIKNPKSHTSLASKRVAAANPGCIRVAMSGTPVENRLMELHSIFDFVCPRFLGTNAYFSQTFVQPIERDSGVARSRASERLTTAVSPFLLRRLKTDKDVAPDLPEKVEFMHVVQLTPQQRRLYDAVVFETMRAVESPEGIAEPNGEFDDVLRPEDFGFDDASGMGEASTSHQKPTKGRSFQVFAMLHGCQQACNHPAALPAARWPTLEILEDFEGFVPEPGNAMAADSGKAARLMELLDEILAPPREKVLIFTQYLPTMELIAHLVESTFPTVRPVRFHGGLSREARDQAKAAFTEDPACAVMILTLQAGGVGLTLTAASHVIHFDRCWNPAKEAQATDRAHRIGQQRTVVVHRFLSENTFEERLSMVSAQKAELAEAIVPTAGGGANSADGVRLLAQYSCDELRKLFLAGKDGQVPLRRSKKQRAKEAASEVRAKEAAEEVSQRRC